MAKRVSTRRVRLEQQKATRNLIVAVILAVIIGVVFLFVAVPVIFQFAIDFARSKDAGVVFSDTIPPQKPVFQPPEEFVNTTELNLSGYTEAKAQVELIIDGQSIATVTANDDGEFSFTQNLEEGEHTLVVEASDAAGNQSDSNDYVITVDTTTPTLTIESPENGKIFTLRSEQVVTVSGSLGEPGTVYVSGSLTNTDEEGAFSTRYTLGEGENSIKVRGEDKAGNQTDEQEIKVQYRP